MPYDHTEASAALAAMQAAKARLATAADCPPERHFAFAAVMGALVANPIVPLPWRFVVLPFCLLAIALIVRWDRRRTGMFVNGYRRAATRIITFAMLAAVLACMAGSTVFALDRHDPWSAAVCAIIATSVSYVGSLLWQRRFRREMGVAA